MLLLPKAIFNSNALIVAQVSPGSAIQGSNIVRDGADASAAISAAMDNLWHQMLVVGNDGSGAIYSAIAQLGVFFAVGTLLLFMVQFFKAMMEGDSPQAFTEIIWPLVVVVLLGNHATVLSACTLQLRDIINEVDQQILTASAGSLALQDAYQQAMLQLGSQEAARAVLSQCASLADPQQKADCVKNATQQIQQQSGADSQSNDNIFTHDFSKDLNEGVSNILAASVKGWLIAFGIAFQWIVEISLLLTGIMGPLAVGGSLLPIGQKSIFAWLTGFFSVGMVKLCFNIIVGLVATLVITAQNADSMVFAFATGLLAPVLSLLLAAGGGMAVFNSLSSVASFGLSAILPRLIKG